MEVELKSKDFDLAGSNLCRLCAKVSDSLSPIFNLSPNFKEILALQIKKCLPILQVHNDDLKPRGVCESCICKLNTCQELIESSIKANNTFDEILKGQPLLQENVTSIREPQLKESDSNCYWVNSAIKNKDEILDVATDERVLVVSQLDEQCYTQPNQDFVVMLQVKYNDDELESETLIKESLDATITKEKRTLGDLFESPDKHYFLDTPISEMKSSDRNYPIIRDKSNSKAVCKLCGAKFSRLTRLRAHHTVHHTDTRPHVCDQCDATFAFRWDLTLHQRLHAYTFQCEFCQKAFTVPSKLERHRRTHTGERPFVCPHCEKAFSEKRNLDDHIRTHTGERPYQCDICFKSFRVRTHLTEHQRVHSAVNNFTCKFCNKSFRWKANYALHIKTHVHSKQ